MGASEVITVILSLTGDDHVVLLEMGGKGSGAVVFAPALHQTAPLPFQLHCSGCVHLVKF